MFLYDIESAIYYNSPDHWSLSQIHAPTRKIISAPCYLNLRRRFLVYEFSKNSKFCFGST